jgi:hypothetical protein
MSSSCIVPYAAYIGTRDKGLDLGGTTFLTNDESQGVCISVDDESGFIKGRSSSPLFWTGGVDAGSSVGIEIARSATCSQGSSAETRAVSKPVMHPSAIKNRSSGTVLYVIAMPAL